MRASIVSFLLLAAGPALAQQQPSSSRQLLPVAVRAAGDAITREQLARDLAILAQDAWNGRASLSPGLDSAAEFIIRRLSRAGLRPMGDSGTFRQYYTVRESRPDTAGRYLEIGGVRYRGGDLLDRSWVGPSTVTSRVIYVGHGWRIPTLGIDPYAGQDLRGALVLAHANAPPPGISGRPPAGAQPALRAAFEAGAAAIVFLPDSALLARWDTLSAQPAMVRELEPRIRSAYGVWRVPAVAVRPQVAESLLALSGHRAADLIAGAARREYPASFALGRTVTLHLPAAGERVHNGSNLVAMIQGSDPRLRDEYVTIAAHLDGAVGRAPAGGDTVWNAADDNATGSAAILRMAEELARPGVPRPRRSLVFIWDSGEEVGLWGTRSFAGRPVIPLDRIVAHFNIDMIGATRAPGTPDSAEAEVMGPNEVLVIGPRGLNSDLDSLLERVNRGYVNMSLNHVHDREGDQFFYPRTDAGPFLERGIPTIGFFTGIHRRYHLPSDEAGYLDPVKMEAVARTVLAAVWVVAHQPERPRFTIPPSVPRYQ